MTMEDIPTIGGQTPFPLTSEGALSPEEKREWRAIFAAKARSDALDEWHTRLRAGKSAAKCEGLLDVYDQIFLLLTELFDRIIPNEARKAGGKPVIRSYGWRLTYSMPNRLRFHVDAAFLEQPTLLFSTGRRDPQNLDPQNFKVIGMHVLSLDEACGLVLTSIRAALSTMKGATPCEKPRRRRSMP